MKNLTKKKKKKTAREKHQNQFQDQHQFQYEKKRKKKERDAFQTGLTNTKGLFLVKSVQSSQLLPFSSAQLSQLSSVISLTHSVSNKHNIIQVVR